MDTESRETDVMHGKNYSSEDPPEEIVKFDKILKVRFAGIPNSTDQADVIKDDNSSLDFKTRPSLTKDKMAKNQFGSSEKNIKYGDSSNNYVKSSPHSCQIRENEILSEPLDLLGDFVKDENNTLHAKSEAFSTKENFCIKQPDCIEKICNNNYPCERSPHKSTSNVKGSSSVSDTWSDAASPSLANQASVIKDENDVLNTKPEPSSSKGKLYKSLSGCTVVFRGNDISSVLESRNLARAFWAVMAGFGVGLLYGLFNSYTNISFYDCVCYVIFLTLYLIFF